MVTFATAPEARSRGRYWDLLSVLPEVVPRKSPAVVVGVGLYEYDEPVFTIVDGAVEYQEGAFPCAEAPWAGEQLEDMSDGIEECDASAEAQDHRDSNTERAKAQPRNYWTDN